MVKMSFVALNVMYSLIIVGCCGLVQPKLPHPILYDGERIIASPDVQMEHLAASDASTKRSFEVNVRFYEWTDYDQLIQEIHLPDGATLVEVFKMPNGRMLACHRDVHTQIWADAPANRQVRRMFLYPGKVKGVDWRGTFAQLPQNKDGSVKTNTGARFNADYQWKGSYNKDTNKWEHTPENGVNFETRGEVVEERRDLGFWWTVVFENGKVQVVIPPGHTYVPEDATDKE